MPLTVTLTETSVQGNKRVNRGTMAFDSSYPTGGEVFTNRQFGLTNLDELVIHDNEDGLMFEVDYADKKIKVICPTGGAAPTALGAPSAAVPSGGTAVTSTAAQPNLVETGGQGVEMGDTADLSGVTNVRWMAYGS